MQRQIEQVSKLEAAERQLVEAIRLFFEERDRVAIHTLVSAAHQVLADVGRIHGYGGVMRNPELVKKGKEAEYLQAIKRAENFFKRADRNPNESIEFAPFLTEIFLNEALQIYRVLTGTMVWEFGVYGIWFTMEYPQLVVESPYRSLASA